MRSALGIFGGIGGAVVVAMAALYGFTTSDTALSGVVIAFFFGVIALGAVGGPAAVVHLGPQLRGLAKLWVVPTAIVVVCAILGNLSNSLGALVGRGDKTVAERKNASDAAKDQRAELARLTRERAAMTFAPATDNAVTAARSAIAAAERTRIAECGNGDPRQRGLNCRTRESEEATARNALATVITNKEATDRAAKLDADAAAVRARLEKAPLFGSVNPLADALAHILRVPAADAATWRDFFLVAVAELLIAGALAAFEALRPLGRDEPQAAPIVDHSALAEQAQAMGRIAGNVVPMIAARKMSTASVEDFMLACVKRAKGTTVTWAELFVRYRRWCEEHTPALGPVDAEVFGRELDRLRSEGIIRTRAKGQDVHCLDLCLAA